MEYLRRLKLGEKVSFVLYPMDVFTGEPLKEGAYKIVFPQCVKKPLIKQDGHVVFCGLQTGDYELRIISEKYFNADLIVSVLPDSQEPLVTIVPLNPKPNYSFGPDAALCRFNLIDDKRLPLKEALVEAEIITPQCIRGKIARKPANKGESDFFISSPTGILIPGEHYYVGADSSREKITVDKKLEDRHYSIKDSFRYEHQRSSLLVPLTEIKTNEGGEALIYFRPVPLKSFEITISVSYRDIQIRKLEMEKEKKTYTGNSIPKVEMEEGKTAYLGDVRVYGNV